MLQALVVGFGKSGQELHLHCLRKMEKKSGHDSLIHKDIGIVDICLERLKHSNEPAIKAFCHLNEVEGFEPATTVVHVCTAPPDHLSTLRQIVERGYTKIIVEKPLVCSLRELEEVVRLQEKYSIDLIVVANWLSSSLTAKIKAILNSGQFGSLQLINIKQCKPRYTRTLDNYGHATAFDVELPHEAALALYLGGQEDVRVISAKSSDMRIAGAVIPHMGSARMKLQHATGIVSVLHSDLTAPVRKRSVELRFEKHIIVGYFPPSGDENYSQLFLYDEYRHILEISALEDDPLTACFIEYYLYFSGKGKKPVSDLSFNTATIRALCQAKALCEIKSSQKIFI